MRNSIGVLSDTHISSEHDVLPSEIFHYFSEVALILHAGDITHSSVIDRLSALAPVIAVAGNMDSSIGMSLHESQIIPFLGFRIGLIHGRGSPHAVRNEIGMFFSDKNLDVIIHGHSHIPYVDKVGQTLWINPGSPTDNRTGTCGTIALLTFEKKYPEARIIRLENG